MAFGKMCARGLMLLAATIALGCAASLGTWEAINLTSHAMGLSSLR